MDYKALRMRGLWAVKQNWGLSIGAAAMVLLLAGIGTSFLPQLDLRLPAELEDSFGWVREWNYQVGHLTVRFDLLAPLGLARFIIGGVIELGYCLFLLKQHDGNTYEFGDLFSQFDRFGTGFAQKFLRELYIFLWSLLLIVPGIIAEYSYAMTPYILAEHPDMTANDAISASKELMEGHRMELFILHLTFIGWDLLAVLTLNIGQLWLNPYRQASEAAFYRQICTKRLCE